MEYSVEIKNSTLLSVHWGDWEEEQYIVYSEVNNFDFNQDSDFWEDILGKERRKYEIFLSNLVQKYNNNFRYVYNEPLRDSVIVPKDRFPTLKSFIDMIVEIIAYLDINYIPWYINDIFFQFSDKETGGVIRFDHDKEAIKIYYVDPKYELDFKKKIVPMRKSKKMK